jgi:hypothetical protein
MAMFAHRRVEGGSSSLLENFYPLFAKLPGFDSGEKRRKNRKSEIKQVKGGVKARRYRREQRRREIIRIRVALIEAGVGVGLAATGIIGVAVQGSERRTLVVIGGGAVGKNRVLDYTPTLVDSIRQRGGIMVRLAPCCQRHGIPFLIRAFPGYEGA